MLNLTVLMPMVLETVRDPRTVAARIMALDLGRDVLWQALALVVVLSILLAELSAMAFGSVTGQNAPSMFVSPLRMGMIQLSLLVILVFAIFWVGRAVGGQGRFRDGLALVVWLQFIMVCLQVLQTVALLVVPPLAWMIGIFGLVLFMWLLTHFVAVQHGFLSLGKTFMMILLASFGFAFGLSVLLALIGVTVPGMEQ